VKRVVLVMGASALLGACSTLPPPVSGEHAAIRERARADKHAAFSLSGRFVVKGPQQSVSAGLDWAHSDALDELQVNGPLGKTLARLTRDVNGVRLVDDRQRISEAATLDELASELFGARVPLTRAAGWVTARPGTADVLSRDALGRVSVLAEQGWRVEYTAYEDDTPDALPRQIEASDGEYSLRLRVDAWYLLPP
jgi:outer membrane lipoprotein LolB